MTFRQWVNEIERPTREWVSAKGLWAKAAWWLRNFFR